MVRANNSDTGWQETRMGWKEDMVDQIICGDSLMELKKLDDNAIDLVCTDPPYGYSFMGKDWDKAVPSVEIWQECLRVLKPGAFCFVMSAPRSDVQMHMIQNLTEAGFRLDFTPIYWTYASGFPKAGNIGKLVDKRLGVERQVTGENQNYRASGQAGYVGHKHKFNQTESMAYKRDTAVSPQAKSLDGSYAGFQPKPAVEVIIVAMKPLSEKTFVDQALKNGKGITWLDDVRIPTDTPIASHHGTGGGAGHTTGVFNDNYKTGDAGQFLQTQGRFPANLLVSDDVLNDGVERKSGSGDKRGSYHNWVGDSSKRSPNQIGGDTGSYSRYFDLDKWANTLPFLIVPKASKSEKNKGLDGFEGNMHKTGARTYDDICANCNKKLFGDLPQRCTCEIKVTKKRMTQGNFHPTVKPLKLMTYLITLGSREGDLVLDPFVGSGTTCLAAKKLGRQHIGIEREPEYVEISKARLGAVQPTLL